MTAKDLQELYDYGYWANRRLFDGLSQLTSEEFTRPVAGSYGSIRNTLVHAVSAEWGWLDRCGGARREARLNPDDFPTLQSVIDVWSTVEGHVREFLSALTDADTSRTVEFSLGGPEKHAMAVGDLMHHAAIHAIHHRGQVALLTRMLAHSAGNFDALFYYSDKRLGV
jgi:uncharacterized damage-inducible protein DinB